MSRYPHRLGPLAALAAVTALSACSTVSRIGDAVWPFDGANASVETAPQDGRVSILASEQELIPDPALAAQRVSPPPAIAVADWTQPGGTADNSPPQSTGAAVLQRAWRADVGAGSNDRVQIAAPPIIAEGRLFFLDADQRIHAIDALDGTRVWSQRLRATSGRDRVARGGGLAASGGRVFVSTGFGFVAALDAASGDEVWRAQSDAPFQSAPTVAG